MTIEEGNVYITTGTVEGTATTNQINDGSGGVTVKIWATKIDQNLDNPVSLIAIPVSKAGRAVLQSGDLQTHARAIDLKRIKESVSVQGFLEDEAGKSAWEKKKDLLRLAFQRGELTLVWGIDYTKLTPSPGTETHQTLWTPNRSNPLLGTGAFIGKIQFTETAGKIGEAEGTAGEEPPESNIAIQIQFLRGLDI